MRPDVLLSAIAALAALGRAQHQDQPHPHDHQRRWVWGTSIIQDVPAGHPTPTDVPPIGQNVDQFHRDGDDAKQSANHAVPPSAARTVALCRIGQAENTVAAASDAASFPSSTHEAVHRLPFWQLKAAQHAAEASAAMPSASNAAPVNRVPFKDRQAIAAYYATRDAHTEGKRYFPGPAPTTTIQDPSTTSQGAPPASEASIPGTWQTTPDAGARMSRPTFPGPPGVMPSGGVPGSDAISHPSATSEAPAVEASAAPVPALTVQNSTAAAFEAAVQLAELNQTITQLVSGLKTALGLHKRDGEGGMLAERTLEKREPRSIDFGKEHFRRVRRHGAEMRSVQRRGRAVEE